jgi:ubiquinone/menaquinone biosynthesis C-methylase UbiE
MEPKSDSDIRRFDQWASSYDSSVLQRFFFVPVHGRMLRLLAEGGGGSWPATVVDVGCGTGRLLRAAALSWPDARLFGVDPAEHMVSEAARLNPKASFKLGPAESLPFADSTVDLVMSSLSFHHWGDQAKGIREISRILRPGGRFCLADHDFPLARLTGEKVKSRSQVRDLMMAAGLAVLTQRGAGLPFLMITLARK